MTEPYVDIDDTVTKCGGCVFATYNSEKRQTGCKLGRLDKFIAELDDEGISIVSYQPYLDKNCAIIRRKCNARRVYPWSLGMTDEDQIKAVRKEIRPECEAIIYFTDENTLEQLATTINSCGNQFKAIQVLNNSKEYRKGQLLNFMREYDDKCRWLLKTTILKDDGTLEPKGTALNMAVRHVKAPYYAYMNPGFEVPPNYVDELDKEINEDLNLLLAKEGDENHNGFCAMKILHQFVAEFPEVYIDNPIQTFLDKLAGNESCEVKDEEQEVCSHCSQLDPLQDYDM